MPANQPVAVIAGGTGAIAQSIAHSLDSDGWNVVIAGRDQTRTEACVAETRRHPMVMDVADADQVAAGFKQIIESLGRVDLLINAAGVRVPLSPLLRINVDDWEEQHAVHSRGAMLTSQQALKIMRRQGSGTIINIASVAAKAPVVPGYAGYAAAKAAMVSLTRSINLEAGQYGVRATALCPTFVDTPVWKAARMDKSVMLTTDAVTQAILFLVHLPPGTLVELLELGTVTPRPKPASHDDHT